MYIYICKTAFNISRTVVNIYANKYFKVSERCERYENYTDQYYSTIFVIFIWFQSDERYSIYYKCTSCTYLINGVRIIYKQ